MKTPKVIYIDDDRDDREIFEQIVSGMDRKVMLISSGMHFFDSIYDELIENSIVFVDLNLPKISGQEIITQLRKKFTPQQLPIIVLSGSNHPGIIDQCYQCGASAYLNKPACYADFCNALQTVIDCNWRRHSVTRDNFELNLYQHV